MPDKYIHPFVAAKTEAELIAVKREVHDNLWGEVRRLLEAAIAAGETELSRVIRIVERQWRDMTPAPAEGTAFGRPTRLPRSALIGGRQAFRMRSIADAASGDEDLVLELGCGWGFNLADLYLAGGPRDAAYWGLDLSPEGVECLAILATLRGGPNTLRGATFNYLAPDFSSIPPARKSLLFTCHSIELIQTLDHALFARLFEKVDRIVGVHHEPVGWQVRAERGWPPAEIGATRENSARSAYNENFWPLLRELEGEGLIRIRRAEPDVFGHKRKNASTLIVWERR